MLPINSKRPWAVALAALFAGAVGCGGKVGEEPKSSEPLASAPPPASPASPATGASSSSSRPIQPPPVPPVVAPRPLPPPLPRDSECDCADGAVTNVLMANCGQCHGPLVPATNSGGINFIDDLDRLVEAGLIVPLSSASSRIVIVMRDGSMPPPRPGFYPVTEADMNIVVEYIDNPRFWPDVAPPSRVDAGVEVPLADAGADGG